MEYTTRKVGRQLGFVNPEDRVDPGKGYIPRYVAGGSGDDFSC
jgi:hypothetical protein